MKKEEGEKKGRWGMEKPKAEMKETRAAGKSEGKENQKNERKKDGR